MVRGQPAAGRATASGCRPARLGPSPAAFPRAHGSRQSSPRSGGRPPEILLVSSRVILRHTSEMLRALALVLLVSAPTAAQPFKGTKQPDVRYVPSPDSVVD